MLLIESDKIYIVKKFSSSVNVFLSEPAMTVMSSSSLIRHYCFAIHLHISSTNHGCVCFSGFGLWFVKWFTI